MKNEPVTRTTRAENQRRNIMKTIIFTAAALIMSATFTTTEVEAKGSFRGGSKSVSSHGSHGSHFRTSSFRGGYHGSFRGHHSYHRNYRGWSNRCWFPRYN